MLGDLDLGGFERDGGDVDGMMLLDLVLREESDAVMYLRDLRVAGEKRVSLVQ